MATPSSDGSPASRDDLRDIVPLSHEIAVRARRFSAIDLLQRQTSPLARRLGSNTHVLVLMDKLLLSGGGWDE